MSDACGEKKAKKNKNPKRVLICHFEMMIRWLLMYSDTSQPQHRALPWRVSVFRSRMGENQLRSDDIRMEAGALALFQLRPK